MDDQTEGHPIPRPGDRSGGRKRIRLILAEAKNYIVFCIILFIVGAGVGYAAPSSFTDLLGSIQSLADRLAISSPPAVILLLFLQNATSAFVAIWLGLILGLVPLAGAVANGIILGAVLAIAGGPMAFLALIPHGMFELPAIFIAWGLGLWRGMWLFQEEKKKAYKERARKAYYVYFTLVLPLLAIAAVIEGLGIVLAR
ncbi:MAG: stage II sporulation protein M [Deltaproteobacteria bacterium]|jgi:stage II sporulation protein M